MGGVSLAISDFDYNFVFSLNPNPTSGNLTINSPNILVDKIEIINSLWQIVHTKQFAQNNITFQINDLTSGVYFVKLYNNGRMLKTERLKKN